MRGAAALFLLSLSLPVAPSVERTTTTKSNKGGGEEKEEKEEQAMRLHTPTVPGCSSGPDVPWRPFTAQTTAGIGCSSALLLHQYITWCKRRNRGDKARCLLMTELKLLLTEEQI